MRQKQLRHATFGRYGSIRQTGWRVVDEALNQAGPSGHRATQLKTPPALVTAEQEGRLELHRLELGSSEALHHALKDCAALVIATGGQTIGQSGGPLQVDASEFRPRYRLRRSRTEGLSWSASVPGAGCTR